MTPSSEDLAALLSRVEAATGPDREIDKAINRAVGRDNRFHQDAGYTASLDSALALCTRVLPGWAWMAGCSEQGDFFASLQPSIGDDPFNAEGEDANGNTPALALIAAILNALIVQSSESGEGDRSSVARADMTPPSGASDSQKGH